MYETSERLWDLYCLEPMAFNIKGIHAQSPAALVLSKVLRSAALQIWVMERELGIFPSESQGTSLFFFNSRETRVC